MDPRLLELRFVRIQNNELQRSLKEANAEKQKLSKSIEIMELTKVNEIGRLQNEFEQMKDEYGKEVMFSKIFLKKQNSILQQHFDNADEEKEKLEKAKSDNMKLHNKLQECKEQYENEMNKVKEEKNLLLRVISQQSLKEAYKDMEESMKTIKERSSSIQSKSRDIQSNFRGLMDELNIENRKLEDEVFAVKTKLKPLIKGLKELNNLDNNNTGRRSARLKNRTASE